MIHEWRVLVVAVWYVGRLRREDVVELARVTSVASQSGQVAGLTAERNRNDVKVAVQASIAHEHDDGKARWKNALEVFRGGIC